MHIVTWSIEIVSSVQWEFIINIIVDIEIIIIAVSMSVQQQIDDITVEILEANKIYFTIKEIVSCSDKYFYQVARIAYGQTLI